MSYSVWLYNYRFEDGTHLFEEVFNKQDEDCLLQKVEDMKKEHGQVVDKTERYKKVESHLVDKHIYDDGSEPYERKHYLIKCAECIHHSETSKRGHYYCRLWDGFHDSIEDYCSYGTTQE